MALTNTAPASISSMQRRCSSSSFVHTLEPSPKVVELATSMAASRSGTRSTMATGPKSSSWATGMSGVTPESTVGLEVPARALHRPRPRAPPRPGSRASSIWPSSSARCASVTMGPTWVAGSKGSPTTSASMAAVNRRQELVGHRLDHDEALGGDAGLAVVLHAGGHRRPHGVVEVGRGQHDEGVRAAELEHALLQGVPGRRRPPTCRPARSRSG